MIYRKLRDYIETKDNITICIFGTLQSDNLVFWFDGRTYIPHGVYYGQYDFLLDYYVVGIQPDYEIKNDKICPYNRITLRKEIE